MNIEYKTIPLSNIKIVPKDTESQSLKAGVLSAKDVSVVSVDGEDLSPTTRFWNSIYSRFQINDSFFRFFKFSEVFDRIAEKDSDPKIRVSIERGASEESKLLAVTNPNKPLIVYDDIMDILSSSCGKDDIKYSDGIVTSVHQPRVGNNMMNINGDDFIKSFNLDAPIDGYGNTNIFLSCLRLICSNGMVGVAKAFQSTVALGKSENINFTLRRALDGFQNEEGYSVLRERNETASRSWVSLGEQQKLYGLLLSLQGDIGTDACDKIVRNYENLTGNPVEIYYRQPNAFSPKKMANLPVKCKMYDLLNFVTEVATHNVSNKSARKLNSWVGETLANEYDLENSSDVFEDWRDFFMPENSARNL